MEAYARGNAQRITLWAAVALLLVIGAAPLLAMLTASVTIDGKPSLLHYQALASSRRVWVLLGQTLTLSSLTALCGTVLGVPLGVLLGKTDLPLRHLFLILFCPADSREGYFEGLAELTRDGRQPTHEDLVELMRKFDQYLVPGPGPA